MKNKVEKMGNVIFRGVFLSLSVWFLCSGIPRLVYATDFDSGRFQDISWGEVIIIPKGCGSERQCGGEILGMWKAVKIEAAGRTAELNTTKLDITFKVNKTCTMNFPEGKAKGSWEKKEGGYQLKLGGVTGVLTLIDGKLIWKEKSGNIKITFKR